MWLALALQGCSSFGLKNLERVLSEGLQRQYVVHVPDHVDPSREPAVVIMLHGTSGTGARFYNISGWVEKADSIDEDLIVVFPTALEYCHGNDDGGIGPNASTDLAFNGVIDPVEWRVTTKWNAGELGGQRLPLCPSDVLESFLERSGVSMPTLTDVGGRLTQDLRSDEQFLRTVLDDLRIKYGHDPNRVYVTGFSNGGSMAMYLSYRMEEDLAAIAASSGSVADGVVEGANPPRPFVLTWGSVDPGMLMLTSDPKAPGKPLDELPLDDDLFLQEPFREMEVAVTDIQHLTPVHTSSISDEYGATRGVFRYSESELGLDNEAQIWMVKDVEHEYPNGSNARFSMADALWDFFRQYER